MKDIPSNGYTNFRLKKNGTNQYLKFIWTNVNVDAPAMWIIYKIDADGNMIVGIPDEYWTANFNY